jgi:hypothetical protein
LRQQTRKIEIGAAVLIDAGAGVGRLDERIEREAVRIEARDRIFDPPVAVRSDDDLAGLQDLQRGRRLLLIDGAPGPDQETLCSTFGP